MRSLVEVLRPLTRVALLVSLLITLAASVVPASAQTESVSTRRIWKGETANICCYLSPKPSPDGRYVPGVDWESGDLAYLDLEQDRWVRISDTGGWVESGDFSMNAIFSPDGTQLAHSWWDQARATWDLRVVDADGKNTRVLTPPSEDNQVWPLDWSPDGQVILAAHAFVASDPRHFGFEFLLVSANGGEASVIKEFDPAVSHNATFARFSPDGQWIAYTEFGGEPPLTDVRLLSLDGTVDRGLVTGNGNDNLMGWMSDGSGILFHSERNLTEAIWRLPVLNGSRAGDPELIKSDVWDMIPMGFGPAGFYYMVPTQTSQVYTAALDFQRGEIISPPSPVRDLSGDLATYPFWSPDGRQLAFLSFSGPAGRAELVVQTLETGETHTVAFPFDNPRAPSWAPDGRTINVQAGYQGVGGFYSFDLQSREVTTLFTPEMFGEAGGLQLSRDGGKAFYGTRSEDGRVDLRSRELETGEDQAITTIDRGPARFIEIPGVDRFGLLRWMGNAQTALRITTIASDGSEARTLWECSVDFLNFPQMTVTHDGKHIILSDFEKDGVFVLWTVDTETGEHREVYRAADGDPSGAMRNISLHPDGSRIAFHRGEGQGEIWVMEGIR